MKRCFSIMLTLLFLFPAGVLAQDRVVMILMEGNRENAEYTLWRELGTEALGPARYGIAHGQFEQIHPGVSVSYETTGSFDPMDAYYQALPGSAVDIVCASYADLQGLYDKGLLADLAGNPAMAETLAAWPEVAALLGDGERVYAVPESLHPELMRVQDPALLETLGITFDAETWTWEDFFAIGDKVYAHNQANGTQYVLLSSRIVNPAWLVQILHNERDAQADPDGDMLRMLLSRWKEMIEGGLVVNPVAHLTEAGLAERTLFSLESRSPSLIGEGEVYLPPVYKEGIARRTAITGPVYFVNAHSPGKDAAIDFLACYFAPEAVQASLWYNDNGLYQEDTGPLHTIWRQAIESGYMLHDDDALSSIYALCESYLEGRVTLDKCAERMMDRIRVMKTML